MPERPPRHSDEYIRKTHRHDYNYATIELHHCMISLADEKQETESDDRNQIVDEIINEILNTLF